MLEKVNILMVDDMEDNLVALEAVLGGLRQNLVRASSGEEALKAVLRREFAVVLMDVLMPGMDGFDTVDHIKRLEQTRTLPIIFLTGVDSGRQRPFRGYAAGAVDYLTKPFDPWVLRAKVAVFVELYLKNRRLQQQAELLRGLLGDETDGCDLRILERIALRLNTVEERMRLLGEAGPPRPCPSADCPTAGRPPGGPPPPQLSELAAEVAALREQVQRLDRDGREDGAR